MEAGRTNEKRAVKSIGKIRNIDYKRELEALAVFSYKPEVQPGFCSSCSGFILIISGSLRTPLSNSSAGTKPTSIFILSWTFTSLDL